MDFRQSALTFLPAQLGPTALGAVKGTAAEWFGLPRDCRFTESGAWVSGISSDRS